MTSRLHRLVVVWLAIWLLLVPNAAAFWGLGGSDSTSGEGEDGESGDSMEDSQDLSYSASGDTSSTSADSDQKAATFKDQKTADAPSEYGVDVSFPIHHLKVSDNYAWLPHNLDSSLAVPSKYRDMVVQPLGDRQAAYDEFINGCVEKWGGPNKQGRRCIETEKDRIEMSIRQPQSMQNYTDIGFKKIRAPDDLFQMIQKFWEDNKDKAKLEQWGIGNTYTNNWKTPSEFVSVEDSSLRGGGYKLKQKIWDAARSTISEWTGEELTQCSLYGIRVYKEGAILATHVDRLPLVSSAIVNVASDVDEPWPLEVYGHDGKAYNVTMEPGDMVLYESHSVLHGRPFPLKGRYVANVFIHFEPTGHSLRHNMALEKGIDVHKKYKEALDRGQAGHEHDNHGLPSYIRAGSPEEKHWRQQHPEGLKEKKKKGNSFTTGSTEAHQAAQVGDVAALADTLKENKELANARDRNGWTPLHEAARGGHVDAVKLLVQHGADINAKAFGDSSTPLYWAKQRHGEDSMIVTLLESLGGVISGPEL